MYKYAYTYIEFYKTAILLNIRNALIGMYIRCNVTDYNWLHNFLFVCYILFYFLFFCGRKRSACTQ